MNVSGLWEVGFVNDLVSVFECVEGSVCCSFKESETSMGSLKLSNLTVGYSGILFDVGFKSMGWLCASVCVSL